MSIIWTVLLTLLLFAVVIFVHEGGHLLCAKACGIYVEEFSIGMGPLLFSFQKGETTYSLRLLPIGGYCKMPGEDGESDHVNGFDKKSVPKRMLVVAGGALFNILFALLLFVVVYMSIGTASDKAIVGDVQEGYPAYAVGLEEGDRITAIDGTAVDEWTEMTAIVQQSAGEEILLTIDRDGESLDIPITPMENEEGLGVLGIVGARESVSVFEALKIGLTQTYELTKLILTTLWQMITGAIGLELSGPVGVGHAVGQVVQYGFVNFVVFIATISVNLGIMNLLPLPALDGSRLVFLALEGIRRKPVSAQIEGTIHFVGFALLMLLFVVITYFDITRIFG
ncbi:MAG: RIP metalloprotease RseP [Firmicutes bacterium]|nr:RIP metalloprotease RseP [Bacillota bacterium]